MAALVAAAATAEAQARDDTINVIGQKEEVSPDAPEGSYHQPQWTTARLFTNSRVYVLKEHQVEVEAWAKLRQFQDTTQNYQLFQQEIEYGFARHFQFDVYVNEQNYYNPVKGSRMYDLEGFQLEVRYAFADWGQIWGNPTLYLEYHPIKDSPERAEVRLLFGDNLAANWHWSLNVGYEQDLWGKKDDDHPEQEVPVDLAIGTTALCPSLSIGFEVKNEWQHHPAKQSSGKWQQELDVGPSFQWRPTKGTHIDVAPLFGVKDVSKNVSPRSETWIILGSEV